jgi:putative transposase
MWMSYNMSSSTRKEVRKMAMKTFKYRIYPTKAEAEKLQWTLDRCREVYNAALQERRDRYDIAVKRNPRYYDLEWRKQATKDYAISLYDQQNQLSPMKKERTEYQELSAAHILNDVCARVDKAFKGFFGRIKKGKTPGYPRFQGYNRYDSFCYPDKSGWKLKLGEKKNGKLILAKIGDIKIKFHRPIEGKAKTCTIKREGDHWYATFACEVEIEKLPLSYKDVGIDLGLEKFAATSDGDFIENPRHYRRTEKRLKKLQEALSRKKRGSSRRKKAVKEVARAHRKVRNQRKDFHHKESRKLVNTYQVIVFEDLQAANLSKRPKPKQDETTGQYLPNGASAKGGLNKSINDAGWYSFTEITKAKAEWAGRTVLFVNPSYTSQVCSGCGTVRKKSLDERWHSCECGCELDRDTNAAINILRLGTNALARG